MTLEPDLCPSGASPGLNLFHTIQDDIYTYLSVWYGVVNKKVLHKSEEKMHKKVKMTSQRAKNLVHVKQNYGVSYSKKIFFSLIFIADMVI